MFNKSYSLSLSLSLSINPFTNLDLAIVNSLHYVATIKYVILDVESRNVI